MLLVPYSSIMVMTFLRRPVRMEAITTTTSTPITTPSTVSTLRSLWARTLSMAMRSVSEGTILMANAARAEHSVRGRS